MPNNRIASLRQKRGQVLDAAEAILAKAGDEDRELTEEEQAEYEAKLDEAAKLRGQIEREERLEQERAKSAMPVAASAIETPAAEPVKREPGIAVARIIRSLISAKGDLRRAAEYCENRLQDPEIAKALAAGDAEAGGFMVPETYRAELIELLRPVSAVRRLNPVTVPLTNGTLTMPKLTGGSTASYIGENENVPKTEPTFGDLRLTERKLAALVPISNDLIRNSSPSADAVVRDDLIAALAQKSDLEFIRGDGTGAGPKGLRYWCPSANLITVNATVNLANVTVDLGKLRRALMSANVRMLRPGYIFSPRTLVYLETLRDGNGNKAFPEIANGRLGAFPFAVTSQIPENLTYTGSSESEIYFADFADVIIGESDSLELEVSSVAAYHDGSAVVAAFSKDQTVIRAIERHDFGMRHDASVAILPDVDWGA